MTEDSRNILKASALIVAGGKGARMGGGVDKLFLTVAGRPVVEHTWERFDRTPCIAEVVLVIRDGLQPGYEAMAAQFGATKPHRFVVGGGERQDSVWNGLQALDPEAQIVAIQDGARPCTSPDLIAATIQAAHEIGAAVAAQPVSDTIKASEDGVTIARHLRRATLWAVQTPQTFRVDVIRRALARVREQGLQVTDDTAACELIGQAVKLVATEAPNPKVTVPTDVPYIEMLLRGEAG